ncbi:MAG TPA: type II toxin-antitoxin system VapC family toxin [Rhizomicrobium sp.]|nr:type II toxin-antitoxin system VapC family toxin [Rhizomicrobium sp.]
MIVIDASAALDILLGTSAAKDVMARLSKRGETIHAPHLLDIEVAQVIRRRVIYGDISSDRGSAALTDLSKIAIQRYPHDFLLPRIWELRHRLTAYDAAYIALAESLDAPLLTRDRRIAAAAGHYAQVLVV